MPINKSVRRRRLELNMTQEQLAAKAGLTRVTIINLENGKSTMERTKYSVAKALDCDLEELFPDLV